MKIGLWIPPRIDLTKSVSIENPAKLDARLYAQLVKYLKEKGIEFVENLDFRNATVKNDKVYCNGTCLSDFDQYIWFGEINREPTSYHLEILRVLELHTKVSNPHSFISLGLDKFKAFSLLHSHGVPVSELFLVNGMNFEELCTKILKTGSLLLKPRRGGFGKGIIKIDEFEQLRDTVDYANKEDYYLEKFYENDMNKWVGLTVINGNVIYGYRKNPDKIDKWKIIDRKRVGGSVFPVVPDKQQIEIAKKIHKILGANFFGIDIIKTKSGYKVVDINCFPGLYYDFMNNLKIDFPKVFFKMLKV